MRSAVLLVVVALVACSGGSTSLKASSPSPTVQPQASADASSVRSSAPNASPATIPNPVVTVTSAGRSLTCRLPVIWSQENAGSTVQKEGFLTFPTGSVSEAPSAPANSLFYDRAYSKWLPVWRQNVSPDGRRYAYTEGNPAVDTHGKLHLVDIASGTDRVLYSGAPVYWVIDFASEGIYVSEGVGSSRSLWLENPAGGLPHMITRSIAYPVIAGGAAWGLAFNPADPHPGPGGIDGPWNELTRLDLTTGASTKLFYRPGTTILPLGEDQGGDLLVGVLTSFAGPEEVWLITPTTTMRKLGTFDAPLAQTLAAADRHGLWFSGAGKVWLYAGGAFAVVASLSADSFAVAGGCIP